MRLIDYDRPATISWLNQPSWGEKLSDPLEEYCDGLTLKEAVTFAVRHLDAKCRKSVIIKCGGDQYGLFDIERLYRDLDASKPLLR